MKQLLLVYNADTRLWARIVDLLTKILRPRSYACNLCMLTFGWYSMIPRWRIYLSQRPEKVVELHRDEFHDRFEKHLQLPAVLLLRGNELTSVLDADEINKITTLDELIERLDRRLP